MVSKRIDIAHIIAIKENKIFDIKRENKELKKENEKLIKLILDLEDDLKYNNHDADIAIERIEKYLEAGN